VHTVVRRKGREEERGEERRREERILYVKYFKYNICKNLKNCRKEKKVVDGRKVWSCEVTYCMFVVCLTSLPTAQTLCYSAVGW
jgi:hypothetical protein